MSETIWRATDLDGETYDHTKQPSPWNGIEFKCDADGQFFRYYGTEKPPPGECWEIVQTRKGDIDTDGDPIGWKIVVIGKDGSVLCEKPNGQRRRYSFADGAKEQPSGEAWERLLNVVADYARNVGIVGPRGETIKEAWKAYEAAQSSEPSDQQATIAELQEQVRKLKVESATQTDAISEREDRIDQLSGEVQRLTAKLERPEMPECVLELVDAVCLEFPGFFAKKIAAVEAHYAPPFRITGPGVYSAKLGKDKELVIRLFHHRQDGWLGYFDGTGAVWLFDDSGRAGGVQLTKLLRPLEG